MPKKIDLSGKKSFRWTVISEVKNINKPGSYWLCKCDCGNFAIKKAGNIKSGSSKSCGCLQRECSAKASYTHGFSKTKLYRVWNTIKFRCYNKNSSNYKNYGKRGIRICEEWKNNFYNFYNWAIKNGYEEGLSIDRINNDGNYEPNNCRFVNTIEQANNTRKNVFITYNLQTLSISQWARKTGISHDTISWRYKKYGACEKVFCNNNLRSGKPLSGMQNDSNKYKDSLR